MITGRYTLFTRIPLFLSADGTFLTGQLWQKDLQRHFDVIADLHLCCPVLPLAQAESADLVVVRGLGRDRVTALRQDGGWGSVLRNLLPNFLAVRKALRKTDIAHSGGAGWAFPLSFYILPLRALYRFQWVVLIESSFWMKPEGRRASAREWLRHQVHAAVLGRCLKRADARIFTQEGYRQFFGIGPERSLIAPAVWVDEDQILSAEAQSQRLAALPKDQTRFLFPARLIADKGVETVLRAIEIAEERLAGMAPETAPAIALDIIGTGPLEERCRSFVQNHRGRISLRLLETVEYGAPFFALLRGYHAMLLANRQQEQPRVIFDAFSQGVPVLSTATTGVQDVVRPETDALLFAVDDAAAMAEAMLRLEGDKALQARLSAGALMGASGHSHSGMHRKRAEFLKRVLDR